MGITIANLTAQIGSDISQFRIGMNEVEARLRLVALKERQYQEEAARYAKKAAEQTTRSSEIREKLQASRSPIKQAIDSAKQDKALFEKAQADLVSMYAKHATVMTRFSAAPNDADEKLLQRMRAPMAAQIELAEKLGRTYRENNQELKLELRARDQMYKQLEQAEGKAEHYTKRAAGITEMGVAYTDVSKEYAARLKQNASEHRIRAANAVANIAVGAGMVTGAALVGAAKEGGDFNQMLLTTAHNTSLTVSGVKLLGDTVKTLGTESGADMEKLAGGFREIENRGFKAEDAVMMLRVSMEAAVAKGSDLEDTTRLLANVMKEFSIPTSRAADTMSVLIETSRRSGTEMSELVHVFGQMSASSANLGVSLLDTSAAYIIMTRHGLKATEAATQFRNDINKIRNPSKQVQTDLAAISKATGIDLVRDFSGAGLRARGFLNVLLDVVDASKKYKGGTHISDTISKLFPLQRGQLGATILTGTGLNEIIPVLRDLTESTRNGALVNQLYQESLAQVNQQLARIKNAAIVAAASVSLALAPSIKNATDWINNQAKAFNDLSDAQKSNIVHTAANSAIFLVLVGTITKIVVAIASLRTALITLGIIAEGTALLPIFTGFLVAAGPVLVMLGALAIGAGILAAVQDNAAHAADRYTDALRRQGVINAQNATVALEHSNRVNSLITEYTSLISNTNRTHDQSARLRDVLNEISVLSPDLITGYDAQGNALRLIADYANQAADAHRRLAEEATRASAYVQATQVSDQIAQRHMYQAEIDKNTYLVQNRLALAGGIDHAQLNQQTGMLLFQDPNIPSRKLSDTQLARPSKPGGLLGGNILSELMGDSNYDVPRTRPATTADIGGIQAEIRRTTQAMKDLDKQTTETKANLHATFVNSEVSRHGRMTRAQIAEIARQAGFAPKDIPTATAIAMAESSGEPGQFTRNTRGKWKGTVDRGLWQINDHFHPWLTDQQSRDPLANARAAFRISQGGRNWQPWTTFREGQYRRYMPQGYDLSQAGVAGGDGIDKMAGIGAKDKKEKESEAEKLRDRFVNDMQAMAHAQFELNHEGREGEALWETQIHGAVGMADGLHVLAGSYANLTTAEKAAYLNMARHTDEMVKQHKQTEKLDELLKSNALKLFEGSAGIGKSRTPEAIETYKMQHGFYKDDYGSGATQASASNLAVEHQKRIENGEQQLKKAREAANKPLQDALSTYDQTIKDLMDEQELVELINSGGVKQLALLAQENASRAEIKKLQDEAFAKADVTVYDQFLSRIRKNIDAYKELGEAGAQSLAKQAQAYADASNATRKFEQDMKSMQEQQVKLTAQKQNPEDTSAAFQKYLELQTDAYKGISLYNALALIIQAKAVDEAQRQLDIEKARLDVKKSLDETVSQAKIDVIGVFDPEEQRRLEFRQKMLDKYGDRLKTLGVLERAELEASIHKSYEEARLLNDREKSLHKVADVMQEIEAQKQKYTEHVKVKAGGVEVTDDIWNRMNSAQQNAVMKFKQLADIKDELQPMLQGVEDLFTKTLDNIREHGFRNFFIDILTGFDDMIYQITKKWLGSQIMTLLTNAVGGLFGGGNGIDVGSGLFGTPPIAGALAGGGAVDQGMSYLVGERGPEIFTPGASGRVASNNESFGGGNTIILNLHGVTDANSFRSSGHQVVTTLHQALAAAGRR